MAQGAVDGAENNPPSFYSSKHYEECKHFSLDGHTRIPDMLMISTKAWDALSPEIQGWLQQAAQESSVFQRKIWKEDTEAALKKVEAEGVKVYKVDTAVFAEKVRPMLDAIENPAVRSLLDQIAEVE